MDFDFITYMADCATRLKDIGHSESAPRFFRASGITQLEELLSSLPDAQFPAMVVHNNEDGVLGDSRADNFHDTAYYAFYIVDRVEFNDHDARQDVIAASKATALKILAKMLRDRRYNLNGLTQLNFGNIPYQTIGPIGDNCYGVMFTFTVTNPANVIYDEDEWY